MPASHTVGLPCSPTLLCLLCSEQDEKAQAAKPSRVWKRERTVYCTRVLWAYNRITQIALQAPLMRPTTLALGFHTCVHKRNNTDPMPLPPLQTQAVEKLWPLAQRRREARPPFTVWVLPPLPLTSLLLFSSCCCYVASAECITCATALKTGALNNNALEACSLHWLRSLTQ
ncbi:hypothetical protein BU23DRAFT_250326 [Bimuria novae-zelandiae CBS 107.79]|uniref:Uncharacterized protein n=1 Tax=Bimuria novae-zelandiae CBS 107.79 TaxID=1447943 RepID=A0A6A5VL88_9PLEO|nr:hypothetical protein BU23DRAFT_250326 [Bimuria novae-zelandiae CBS 107.79]